MRNRSLLSKASRSISTVNNTAVQSISKSKLLSLFSFPLFLLILLVQASTLEAQTINATQKDVIIIDNGTSGKADPNDRIRYEVTIQNTGGASGTGVQLNIVPDPRTTFVPGSYRSSPLAINDSYACTGNVGLNVPAASGVKSNDFDDNLPGTTLAITTAPTNGTATISNDGSFTYTPNAGYNGTDNFSYTMTDGNGVGGSVPNTDIATVTITVSNMIWFIDNTGGGSGGTGTLTNPFKLVSNFNAASGPAINQLVFIKNTGTNYTGPLNLKNGQLLFGTGHTGGTNLADVVPFGLAPNSSTLPAINGTRPVIQNGSGDGINLATDNTVRGLNVGDAGGLAIRNTGSASVGNLIINDLSIINTLGGGFSAANGSTASMNLIFTALTTSGGNGMKLINCLGSVTVNGGSISGATALIITGGTVTYTSSGVILGTTGLAVDIDNHDGNNITQSGNVSSTGLGIRVQNCGGGTITFSGASKSLNTGANTAVTLTSNTGATITFSGGGLVITTSTVVGFNATGGATAVNVTGSGNTITSTTGTALNVVSTTIGASGLTFQSITAGTGASGPTNAIVLNTTGTSGGLTVTGDNGGSNNGSGGTIQHCSGVGVLLTNTKNPNLGRMNMSSNLGEGLVATSVNGLTLHRCNVQNNGDLIFSGGAEGAGEANIEFYELSGTCAVTFCLVEGGKENNMFLSNTGSTALNLTINQSTIRNTPTSSNQGAGCRFMMYGNTNTTMAITQNIFSNNFGQHFEGYLRQNAIMDIDILNNTCTGGAGLLGSSIALNCLGDVNLHQTFEGSLTYDISNNNIQGAIISAIAVNLSPLYFDPVLNQFFQGGGDASGQINNNVVGTPGNANSGSFGGSCISADSRGNSGSTHTVLIQNNQLYQYNNHGIAFTVGETNSASHLNATIQGNTIKNPGSFGTNGIMLNSGTVSSSTDQVCINIGGTAAQFNDIVGAGANGGTDFRLRQRQSTTVFLPGYAGGNTDINAMVAYIQGRNTSSASGSGAVNAPPGGGFVNTAGGVPCATP